MSHPKFGRRRFLASLLVLLVTLSLVLNACGNDTATPVPPPTATPVPATATPIPATATATPALTTIASTTAAAIGATTSSSGNSQTANTASSSSATSGSASTATADLPSFPNVKEVPVDSGAITLILKQVGLSSAVVKLYSSDEAAEKVATNADTALTGAGFKFAFPGANQPINQAGTLIGFYSKANAPDLLLTVLPVPDDPTQLAQSFAVPGISAANLQGIVDQIKGKKSLLFILAGQDLLKVIVGSGLGAGTSATTAAAVTTIALPPTAAIASTPSSATTSGSSVGETDIAVYPGSQRVQGGTFTGVTTVIYTSSDDFDKITAWAKAAFGAKGWGSLNSFDQGGASVITGTKGTANLILTIISPKARGNASFDPVFKQAGAGPNDSVITVLINAS